MGIEVVPFSLKTSSESTIQKHSPSRFSPALKKHAIFKLKQDITSQCFNKNDQHFSEDVRNDFLQAVNGLKQV